MTPPGETRRERRERARELRRVRGSWWRRTLFPNRWSVIVLVLIVAALGVTYWPKAWHGYRFRVGAAVVIGVGAWVASRAEQDKVRSAQEVALTDARIEAKNVLALTTSDLRPMIQAMQDLKNRKNSDTSAALSQIELSALDSARGLATSNRARSVVFLHRGEGQFTQYKYRGRQEDPRTTLSAVGATGDLKRLFERGAPQVCVDVWADEVLRNRDPKPSYGSFVSAAIRTRHGAVFGVLSVDDPEVRGVNEADGETLTAIAELLAASWVLGGAPNGTQPWEPPNADAS